jgi:hypothetical protein
MVSCSLWLPCSSLVPEAPAMSARHLPTRVHHSALEYISDKHADYLINCGMPLIAWSPETKS